MLLLFIVVGLILALVRGGSLKNINNNAPKKLLLPILALLTELIFSYLPSVPGWLAVVIEYILLFYFVACNLEKKAWPLLFGFGTFLNFLVISANGFRMPVSSSLLEKREYSDVYIALSNNKIYNYTIVDTDTRLAFLGDIIAFCPLGKLIGFASIGDIFLGVGITLLTYGMIKSSDAK